MCFFYVGCVFEYHFPYLLSITSHPLIQIQIRQQQIMGKQMLYKGTKKGP